MDNEQENIKGCSEAAKETTGTNQIWNTEIGVKQ